MIMNIKTIKNKLIIILFLIFSVVICYSQDLAVRNTSNFSRGTWNWTIYLAAPQHILQDIEFVDYILYRYSSNPTTVRVSDRGSMNYPWAYNGQSIGFFRIEAKVQFKSGKLTLVEHTLVLDSPLTAQPLEIKIGNVAEIIREGWWSWRVFITADESVLDQIQCVEYTLHPTFPDPVKLVCDRGTGRQAFPLNALGWGTFTIHIRVFIKNGLVQELSHYLRF